MDVFILKEYDKSKIKYRFATDIVKDITSDVPTMCQDILDLAAIYNKLVTEYVVSDEWIDNAISITNTANDTSTSLKTTTIKLVKDINDMLESIETDNRRLQSTVEGKQGELAAILSGLEGINIARVSAPSKPDNSSTPPTNGDQNQNGSNQNGSEESQNPTSPKTTDNIGDPAQGQKDLFDSLNGVDYSNRQCGRLARVQLENSGLVEPNTSNANGIDYARNLANGSAVLKDGHTAVGHETNASNQEAVFDDIVASNGGSASNLVFSFNSKGHYRNSGEFGHVVVVSAVKDGRVYLIDNNNTSWTNKKTQTLDLSVDEFKQHYLREGNEVNYITQIT